MNKKLKILIWMLALSLLTTNVQAFLFEMPVLSKEAIVHLSDDQLVDTYIDVAVELDAVRTFYTNSAFTPKEYEKYKGLLKYRILLIQEMQKRKIRVPKTQP